MSELNTDESRSTDLPDDSSAETPGSVDGETADTSTAADSGEATPGETAGDLTVGELREWLREWVSQATGVPAEQIPDDRPMEAVSYTHLTLPTNREV